MATTSAEVIAVPKSEAKPTLSVDEAAEILGICRTSAYAAIARGEIPSIRINRRIVIPTAAFRKLLSLEA
jgi:excisionase family DNA binding protein